MFVAELSNLFAVYERVHHGTARLEFTDTGSSV
jgi:hypothetical protein